MIDLFGVQSTAFTVEMDLKETEVKKIIIWQTFPKLPFPIALSIWKSSKVTSSLVLPCDDTLDNLLRFTPISAQKTNNCPENWISSFITKFSSSVEKKSSNICLQNRSTEYTKTKVLTTILRDFQNIRGK